MYTYIRKWLSFDFLFVAGFSFAVFAQIALIIIIVSNSTMSALRCIFAYMLQIDSQHWNFPVFIPIHIQWEGNYSVWMRFNSQLWFFVVVVLFAVVLCFCFSFPMLFSFISYHLAFTVFAHTVCLTACVFSLSLRFDKCVEAKTTMTSVTLH